MNVKIKKFFYGQSIGIIASIAGIIGALLVTTIESIIPYALGFAAGAMLFVTIRHIMPQKVKKEKLGHYLHYPGF
jgi:zinc transporter, ZIP family